LIRRGNDAHRAVIEGATDVPVGART
jgi:hypothetical protein